MENLSSNNSIDRKRHSIPVQKECKICGALATYSYYGTIACDSCKMFFKRNAEREEKVLKCHFNGHCKIDVNTRHVCTYCRLNKCLASGMQTGMIRFTCSKTNKTGHKRKLMIKTGQTRSTALVRANQSEQLPTLNLLRSDQSTLTADQWNLISNLSHCYDEHSGISIGERYMREQNILPHKLRLKSASMIEIYQMLYNRAKSLYTDNQDFLSLCPGDRSTLLHNILVQTANLSSNFILYKVRLMAYPTYFDAIGNISHLSVIPYVKRLADRLEFDVITMKLFLAILSFSTTNNTFYSNTRSVNLLNTKQILHIQNTYIELTWKYLIYKHSYEQTVKCFSDLIRCLFCLYDCISKAQDVQWHTNTMDSIAHQVEQSLLIND